tara:strand:+ start:435 stop:638 length:204 start_codon:yes stop_codon:yes gene_type:complete
MNLKVLSADDNGSSSTGSAFAKSKAGLGSKATNLEGRMRVLRDWHSQGGVMVISYDMFRILVSLCLR